MVEAAALDATVPSPILAIFPLIGVVGYAMAKSFLLFDNSNYSGEYPIRPPAFLIEKLVLIFSIHHRACLENKE